MSYKILNKILDIADLNISEDTYNNIRFSIPYELFGIPNNNIAFIGDNRKEYFQLINEFLAKEKYFGNTISRKEVINILVPVLKEKKGNRTSFEDNSFAEVIRSMEISEYIILRDIFGVTLIYPKRVCHLGEFNIYYWPINKKLIEKRFKCNPKVLWLENQHEYLIEVKVNARDKEKAIELANEKFELFTNLLHIQMGRCDNQHIVSIVSLELLNYERIYCFKGQEISSQFNLKNHTTLIPIDEPFYQANNDFQIFWEFISNPIDNKFKKRILLSIKWLGEAYRERSIQNGFLKAAISLEILFTYSEKTIINPSILNQISESIALILGTNAEQRIEIEKEMKKLYSVRSSIAHAGNNEIEEEKYVIICNYSKAIIATLLNNPKYDVSDIEKLYVILKEQKYT